MKEHYVNKELPIYLAVVIIIICLENSMESSDEKFCVEF